MNWVPITWSALASACLTVALIQCAVWIRNRSTTRRWHAEEHFKAVIDASATALLVVDSSGKIRLTNAQAEAVFGYASDELVGQALENVVPDCLGEAQIGARTPFNAATQYHRMEAGRALPGRRKNGSEVRVEISLTAIRTPDEPLTLVTITDVSERSRVEREQTRHRDEATQHSRIALLGELSGAIAHEVNQPLTAILSNAQAAEQFLAQDPPNLDEVRGILHDIVEEDLRAREVIRRLRQLLQQGEVRVEPIDLNALALDVLKRMKGELLSHNITVNTTLTEGLPTVNGDRIQFQQVLINLIANASEAMAENDQSSRVLGVTSNVDVNEGCSLAITDTGCGISPERIDRIFEPFQTSKPTGLGLGLSICRTIVSAHGGKIWASNNSEKGSCFRIAFPSISAGAL